MKLVIITHVIHQKETKKYFAYAPYVREMNIWLKYVDEVLIVAPLENSIVTDIDSAYDSKKIDFRKISSFNLTSFLEVFKTILKIPVLLSTIFRAMQQADHIHLRCPGNIGLIGCFVQILFPNTIKTAKYAGNWDPKSKQPWSYRLQKWILSNTFLTKNMQVLAYGEWERSTQNIKPFFTATYTELEKVPLLSLNLDGSIHFVFVGSLVKGKNPMYAIQLVEKLLESRKNIFLDIYGEGILRGFIEEYIVSKHLNDKVVLHGNQDAETIKSAYQNSHFVILPSKSEGWPKAIAEGMFWGCVPVATAVSCVPNMLAYGQRGVLLQMDVDKDSESIKLLTADFTSFESKRTAAADWSRQYTLDRFEQEIKKILE